MKERNQNNNKNFLNNNNKIHAIYKPRVNYTTLGNLV